MGVVHNEPSTLFPELSSRTNTGVAHNPNEGSVPFMYQGRGRGGVLPYLEAKTNLSNNVNINK